MNCGFISVLAEKSYIEITLYPTKSFRFLQKIKGSSFSYWVFVFVGGLRFCRSLFLCLRFWGLRFWYYQYFMRLAVPLIVDSSLTSYIWTSLTSLTLYVLQSKCQNWQPNKVIKFTWSISNDLFFQPTKYINLCISRKRIGPPRTYSLNGISLKVVKVEKKFTYFNF